MHIDHIALWTNDLEQLKNFYVRFFNCTVSQRYDNGAKGFSSYFLSFDSGARIEIMQRYDVTAVIDKEYIGPAHFAIAVGTAKQVDALTEKLENAGVTIVSYPRTTGDGCYESVIRDPDNNRIELVSS